MKLRFIFIVFLLLFYCIGDLSAQKKKKETVNWLSFDELQDSMENHPKKIFVEVYTDWCGPCKTMDKKIFPKRDIVQSMNKNYYAVKLNSEKADSLIFNDSTYYIKPYKNTKINQLVVQIALEDGHLYYPTIIILNEKYQVIYRYPGMLSSELLLEELEKWK